MAAPNEASSSLVLHSNTIPVIATTSMADLVAAPGSNHMKAVSAIYVNNYSSAAAKITIVVKVGGTEYKLANAVTVRPNVPPINMLLGKSIYLAETDTIRHLSDTATAIVCMPSVSDCA